MPRPSRSATSSRLLAAGLGLLLGPTVANDAWAFCRSTTCKGSGCELDLDGCPVTGKALWWRTHCIGYSLHQNGTQQLPIEVVTQVVQKSFGAWSALPCPGGGTATLTFEKIADTTCIRSEFDVAGPNVNVIVFRDDDFQYKDHGANTLAKTTLHYDAKTGEVFDADIEVNTAYNTFTVSDQNPKTDLQTVLTHEIGHFLGLAHSPEPEAVMYASYDFGTVEGRKLHADDVAAVCAVYPPGRPGTCDLVPAGGHDTCRQLPTEGCAVHAEARPVATGWLAVLGGACLAVGARRRRWRGAP